jgi:hypothetical protein
MVGCASSNRPLAPNNTGAAALDSPLYLIGSFNWWEVDAQYVFVKTGKDTYSTKVELIADGQPYDFIIADEKWSPGYTCGYRSKSKDHLLQLNRQVEADCTKRTNNFQFKPSNNGSYQVTIDFSHNTPTVLIEN